VQVTITVERFNPETDKEAYRQSYCVEVERDDRVLDALIDIKRNQDATLGFRYSCAHGVCGSDAMRINGRATLACKTLFKDVVNENGDTVHLAPLQHMPVERDLMVDQTVFFEKYREVKPYLFAKDEADTSGDHERYQTIEERAAFDEATKCILCGACYSACPVLDENPAFIGPAALVQASRFVQDSRDVGLVPRLDVLDSPNGVWACDGHFECTRACPREIKVTKLINQMKRQITAYRKEQDDGSGDA
jgi:succinate dehydrogenase / fumarate reductase iron-sulfur subunit